jgi:hypothetical protein
MPDLLPQSVEVVERTRDETYAIVRTIAAGMVVLDRSGRIVRSRERLAAVARHARATELLVDAVAGARLDQRRDHAERSIALLGPAGSRRNGLAPYVAALVERLGGLVVAIDVAGAEAARGRALPPTERTLRRAALLLNEAATADRAVVCEARLLAGALAARNGHGHSRPAAEERLSRWLVARLASVDLPFFLPDLVSAETERFVGEFVAAARGEAVGGPA